MLTSAERVTLEFLEPLMFTHPARVGRHIYECGHAHGSNVTAIGAAVLGRLRKRGLVTFLPDERLWRITNSGRQQLRLSNEGIGANRVCH